LIQRYTACRKGAANGLRLCDIDLNKKTITFKAWVKEFSYERREEEKD
jgi:integrase